MPKDEDVLQLVSVHDTSLNPKWATSFNTGFLERRVAGVGPKFTRTLSKNVEGDSQTLCLYYNIY